MASKSARVAIPNTAAGAASAIGSGNPARITTAGDDGSQRHVRGVRIGGFLELAHLILKSGGNPVYDIETGAWAAAAGMIPVDYTYAAGVLFEATLQNDSAAAYNGHALEIIYDVP